jgi:polyhydroxyalkanoate synthesis repressor PhaR
MTSEHEETPSAANGTPPASGDAGADKREPKVIKRYTNRKLYDTVESRYVTLDEIAQMIKGGAEVKIVDNRSKEDLTSVTLAQIIFEEEKKRSQMPLGMLREIIRHGGDAVTGFYQDKVGGKLEKGLSEVKARTESIREDLEQKMRGVTSIFRRDEKGGEAGGDKPSVGGNPVKEVLAVGERAVEELRARVDQGVKTALGAFARPEEAQAEIERLRARVAELEQRLEKNQR